MGRRRLEESGNGEASFFVVLQYLQICDNRYKYLSIKTHICPCLSTLAQVVRVLHVRELAKLAEVHHVQVVKE